MNQLYVYIHPLFCGFPSHLGHHTVLRESQLSLKQLDQTGSCLPFTLYGVWALGHHVYPQIIHITDEFIIEPASSAMEYLLRVYSHAWYPERLTVSWCICWKNTGYEYRISGLCDKEALLVPVTRSLGEGQRGLRFWPGGLPQGLGSPAVLGVSRGLH